MAQRIEVRPLNRVEGDLKVWLTMDGDTVADARSAGTMYRGFENIMRGRGPLDGLVITPRICGICTTAHLNAAAKALDMASGVQIPDNAVRLRNVTLMAEMVQNDVRHSFLSFMPDALSPAYEGTDLYEEAKARYEPLRGRSAVETVAESKKLLEVIAILGGQWPHSSFMVPGGVVTIASDNDVAQCRFLVSRFRRWYEARVLGCSIESFMGIKSRDELFAWLEENPAHKESELGFFLRFCRQNSLEELGRGHGNFICYGFLDLPGQTEVAPFGPGGHLIPAGFSRGLAREDFDQAQVTEDVSHSWLTGPPGGSHPYEGVTKPYATGAESNKYTWAKAPRYRGLPAETGPLAQMVMAGSPLFGDLVGGRGPGVMARVLARMARPALVLPVLDQWLREIAANEKIFFKDVQRIKSGRGHGLVEAPRGALGHWVSFADGRIESYQVVTPTAWNASPKDEGGVRGPWEEALTGLRVKDPENPVEVDHVVRSFDPCLVCTVHALDLSGET